MLRVAAPQVLHRLAWCDTRRAMAVSLRKAVAARRASVFAGSGGITARRARAAAARHGHCTVRVGRCRDARACDGPPQETNPNTGSPMKIRITTLAVLTSGLLLCGASGQALEKAPVLSLDAAQKAAAACRTLAVQKNWRMAIAIADAPAQVAAPERAGILSMLAKWAPLVFKGFLFNLLVGVLAMALGTLAGAGISDFSCDGSGIYIC